MIRPNVSLTGRAPKHAFGEKVRPQAAFSNYMISVWIVTEMRYYCLWFKKVKPATQVGGVVFTTLPPAFSSDPFLAGDGK